jgi:hypothetical protein
LSVAGAGTAQPPRRSLTRPRLQVTPDHLLSAFLLLAVFLTCGLSPMQGDTWWQLRAGSDMWSSGSVLMSDIYSHTAFGAYWSNHEWLAEVVFYAVYRVGGLGLLTLFAAALITGGWMFAWRMTQGAPATAFVVAFVALASASGWWEPRPHAFSLLFLPWMVFLVRRGTIGWLPLLFLVWANTHGGVLLGLVVLGVSLGARTLVTPSSWRQSALVLIGCAAAMTMTPLGVHFWIEIPRSLSRISLYTLDEWSRTELTDPTMVAFWGIAAVYVWELLQLRSRTLSVLSAEADLHACAVVLLPAAIAAVRNVGAFLMVGVPALTHLLSLQERKRARVSDAPVQRTAVNLAIILMAVVGVSVTLALAYRNGWSRLRWTPIPAAAIEALGDCPDNLYNRYDEGGMLLWFEPHRKVFLDGRQDPFPPALVLEHIEMETGRRSYGPTFARHSIRCAFLPVVSPVASQLSRDGWISLFRSDQWLVLKRP